MKVTKNFININPTIDAEKTTSKLKYNIDFALIERDEVVVGVNVGIEPSIGVSCNEYI